MDMYPPSSVSVSSYSLSQTIPGALANSGSITSIDHTSSHPPSPHHPLLPLAVSSMGASSDESGMINETFGTGEAASKVLGLGRIPEGQEASGAHANGEEGLERTQGKTECGGSLCGTGGGGGGRLARTRHGSVATSSSAPAVGMSYPFSICGSTNGASTLPPPLAREDAVPVGFDESVLRALCGLDCGLPLLLDRLKQSLFSTREIQVYLRKRAAVEDEYARSLQKLAKERADAYVALGGEARAGTWARSWQALLRVQDVIADNRLKFAGQLVEMSEELGGLAREVERARKVHKENGARLEKSLQESESATDKARQRFDVAAEELERLVVAKSGENVKDPLNVPHAGSGGGGVSGAGKRTLGKAMSKFKGKASSKQEEEVRRRMGAESDAYRAHVLATQQVRQEYFNLQLPRILRALKEQSDEIDFGSQFHLSRYAHLCESVLTSDSLAIFPLSIEDGPSLRAIIEVIDPREDFRTYMTNYTAHFYQSGQKGPRREGPAEEGFIPPAFANLMPATYGGERPSLSSLRASASGAYGLGTASGTAGASTLRPTFGVDLGEQIARDNVDVPRILEKCASVIEAHGLDMIGIYRLSGTTSRVQRLKAKLDRDVDGVDLESDENLKDVNDVTGVLKLWLRELPEPLMTWDLHYGIIEAGRIENDRLRHIRLHECVNELPDANYAALKFLMGHLDKVRQRESVNSMTVSNLAVIFGPTLLGPPPAESNGGSGGGGSGEGGVFGDMSAQCKAVETILEHYREIFVDEGEDDT